MCIRDRINAANKDKEPEKQVKLFKMDKSDELETALVDSYITAKTQSQSDACLLYTSLSVHLYPGIPEMTTAPYSETFLHYMDEHLYDFWWGLSLHGVIYNTQFYRNTGLTL